MLFRSDINIETDHLVAGEMWTRPSDICDSLRWVGISSAAIPQIDYAVSGGVHDGWAAVKSLLVGASAVEICTTLYWNGAQRITTIKEQIGEWMAQHGYENLNQLQGSMNANATEGSGLFERTKFMKYYSSYKGTK